MYLEYEDNDRSWRYPTIIGMSILLGEAILLLLGVFIGELGRLLLLIFLRRHSNVELLIGSSCSIICLRFSVAMLMNNAAVGGMKDILGRKEAHHLVCTV